MMNRNQKIALGCGGGGCLGLVLLVIVCAVLIVSGVIKAPGIYSPSSNRNYNYNYNYNSNRNSNSNATENSNSDSSSSSSMSDDDKHKMFQAVGMTQDAQLTLKVTRKLGLFTDNGPTDEYQQFVKDHFKWAMNNMAFIQSVNTPEKARAYVDAHIDD
jgi:hypothetical protein